LLIVVPETAEELSAFAEWRTAHEDHVFHFGGRHEKGGALHDLGLRAEVCREPINIGLNQGDPQWRIISNLAPTPFMLRGQRYASVEGFWQGLKFDDDADRARVAELSGTQAVEAGRARVGIEQFIHEGSWHPSGGPYHHRLMYEACAAKFTQSEEARAALLATGERPLTHRTRRDSRTIPGALMADIWMRVRARLRRGADPEVEDGAEPDGRILYFKRDRAAFGFLSHFEPSPIELDGERWPTVEHYYQAQKSLDPDYGAAIGNARTPGEAKQLASVPDAKTPAAGRSWFLRTGRSPRPDWGAVKLDIMRRADWAKFSQNPALAEKLLATGDAELVEDSPFDAFWGTGRDGKGLNWAGRILMEVRERLALPTNPDG
jgi:ribA/ribD-fused uncharacterized protein